MNKIEFFKEDFRKKLNNIELGIIRKRRKTEKYNSGKAGMYKKTQEKIDQKNKKKIDDVIERGKKIAAKIRSDRKQLRGKDLLSYNNSIEAVIKFLKEARFWIDKNNPNMADEFITDAEKHFTMISLNK
jgi:hypothetical protein